MDSFSILQLVLGVSLIAVVSSGSPPRLFKDRLLNLLSAMSGAIAATCAVVPERVLNPYVITVTVAAILVIYLKIRVWQFLQRRKCERCTKLR